MFERILAPLDGSKTAEMVLPYVIEVAVNCGSRIFIARVSESKGSLQECRSYLENITRLINNRVKDFSSKPPPEVELKVLMGNPPLEILNYASELECNLIAIVSSGASGQSQWPLGNVAGKVLRAANCPVLLVRKPVDEEILKGKGLIKKVMVPLDGSKLSETALSFAEELSIKIGAELVLFRAIGPETFMMPSLAMTSGIATERGYTVISSQTRSQAVSYLGGIKNSLGKKGLPSSVAIEEGLPADKIIDYAEANSIDLIVMSTHGFSGIGRWVFGSVTDKVLHAGETPVLVVPPGTMRR